MDALRTGASRAPLEAEEHRIVTRPARPGLAAASAVLSKLRRLRPRLTDWSDPVSTRFRRERERDDQMLRRNGRAWYP